MRDIIEKPELRVYTDEFGTRKGNNCLVANFGGKDDLRFTPACRVEIKA